METSTPKAKPMLHETIKGFRVILASASPRRKELLAQMGIEFEQISLNVAEDFPPHLAGAEIARYLARLKANAYGDLLKPGELLITADTIVWHEGKLLGKPGNAEEAKAMLHALSDDWHEVVTAICCSSTEQQEVCHETTLVRFKKLDAGEIDYYVENFRPFDKAGAYGIQEWLGLVGIAEISGSYFNVVGMPTASLYDVLRRMVS